MTLTVVGSLHGVHSGFNSQVRGLRTSLDRGGPFSMVGDGDGCPAEGPRGSKLGGPSVHADRVRLRLRLKTEKSVPSAGRGLLDAEKRRVGQI